MKKSLLLLGIFTAFLFSASTALARLGVGVGTGKIVVDEELRAGQTYSLPPLTVVNTGDEAANYSVDVAYHEEQSELAPPKEWFSFSPSTFHLEPGATQVVEIKINLALKSEPGKYFAFLEAFPDKRAESEGARIGIAAAAKLYFTVAPANIFQALYFKAVSIWKEYNLLISVVVVGTLVFLSAKVLRKHLDIDIKLRSDKPKKEASDSDKNHE